MTSAGKIAKVSALKRRKAEAAAERDTLLAVPTARRAGPGLPEAVSLGAEDDVLRVSFPDRARTPSRRARSGFAFSLRKSRFALSLPVQHKGEFRYAAQ